MSFFKQNGGLLNGKTRQDALKDASLNNYSLADQTRNGGGKVSNYGELLTDNNGLSYRDVRNTYWNTAFGKLNTDFYREYVPNKAYKKYVTKNGEPVKEYTPAERDSLTTVFNKNFGEFGTEDNINEATLEKYYPHFKK